MLLRGGRFDSVVDMVLPVDGVICWVLAADEGVVTAGVDGAEPGPMSEAGLATSVAMVSGRCRVNTKTVERAS